MVNPEGKIFKFTYVKEAEILIILKRFKALKQLELIMYHQGWLRMPLKNMIKDAAEELCKPLSHLVKLSLNHYCSNMQINLAK